MNSDRKLPLAHCCSGASSTTQMAGRLVVKLDRLKMNQAPGRAGQSIL